MPCEPLAADARKWADGKLLAKLKIVSGILGIRLDDLRQRNMQRRRRNWILATTSAVAVLLLTGSLVFSDFVIAKGSTVAADQYRRTPELHAGQSETPGSDCGS